jgi:long-chain acyl-CoA synthetase
MTESSAQPWHISYQQVGIAHELAQLPYRNLAELAHESCKKWQTESQVKAAFSCVVPNGMNGRLSFSEVDEYSDAFAGYLRAVLGLKPGDRVAVQLPNSLGYPVAALGVFKAGCVLVNTNPLYTETEMIHQFNDSGAQVLVIVDMFADKLPAVLAKTSIKHVVLAEVTAFFPTIPGAIVRGVQRYWNRVLPPVTVPHVRLKDALAQGRATLAKTPARTYWQGIGRHELAVLQYTGGTTGVSKGAMLTHDNLLSNIQQTRAMGQSHMAPGQECVLTALPLYHIFAFTTNLLGFLAIGGHNVLIPSPRPVQNLQRAMENFPITWMTGVNTLFNGLLNEEWFVAYPSKTLKASISGGTALHSTVAKRWRELTKTPIAEGYGLTETSPVVSFNPLTGDLRNGSIGIPAPGTDVRLVNDHGQDVALGAPGEIWVRGPQVMQGYWNAEEETAKVMNDGWFATGDVAVMDDGGFMRIVDRKKDMVLVSGFNVYPNEVEDVIAKMDNVLEVAVIGVPDAKTGEAVRAYVVQNPDHTKQVTSADVLAHCKLHLAAYKVPKLVVVRDDLPKSPIGKVLRKDLRKVVAEELTRG